MVLVTAGTTITATPGITATVMVTVVGQCCVVVVVFSSVYCPFCVSHRALWFTLIFTVATVAYVAYVLSIV